MFTKLFSIKELDVVVSEDELSVQFVLLFLYVFYHTYLLDSDITANWTYFSRDKLIVKIQELI